MADAAPRAGEVVLDAVDPAAPLVALTAGRARDLPALRAHHADVLAFGDEGA